MKDVRRGMIFAHAVPRKGLMDDHGVGEIILDLEKLGMKQITLKCDGESALKHIQEEVRRRRSDETILENSPVGDSRANGIAERAVQSIVGLIRTLKSALENRTGLKFQSDHPVVPWLVEHASDIYNKFHMGSDGKTAYERWKGKPWNKETVEFGELVHFKFSKKSSRGKLDDRWAEGIFVGYKWRTGEAMIAVANGITKAGTIRRTGGDRRWDCERIRNICGSPWKMIIAGDDDKSKEESTTGEPKVRFMTEEEKDKGIEVEEDEIIKPGRVRLLKEDFLEHGFTEGCRGCKALLNNKGSHGHSEKCRIRMEKALESSVDGKDRKRKADDRSNEWMAQKFQRQEEEPMQQDQSASSSGGERPNTLIKKRIVNDESDQPSERASGEKRRKVDESSAADELLLEQISILEKCNSQDNLIDVFDSFRGNWEPDFYVYDPYAWEVSVFEDMCEPVQYSEINYDEVYYDETTWEPLDAQLVADAEAEEMKRFRDRQVYSYVDRNEAMRDKEGKFVKTRWVRINKGSKLVPRVRCRLVAQELAHGKKDDELYAGTPSLSTMKLLLSWYCTNWKEDDVIKIIDVKCAFLYGEARRRIYIELPRQDPQSGGSQVGVLDKAMYGTRDAPLIWRATVDKMMKKLGFTSSMFQPGVYYHAGKQIRVMTHVDDFLVTGSVANTNWFETELCKLFDITSVTLGKHFEKEAKYLNRRIVWTEGGIIIEGDTKHVITLLKEWGMEQCKGLSTPVCKDEVITAGSTELNEIESTRFRRGAARINYMAQDRPDLSVASRILSQGMSSPTVNDEVRLKRVIRYLKVHPRCINFMAWQTDSQVLSLLVDSDWAGDKAGRKSCSGGCIRNGKHLIAHWSKLQGNIALSSGEAELNAAVKGVSEVIGVQEMSKEFGYDLKVSISTDASVCKSILLRHGAGKIKHLTTKQLWVQGAIETYGYAVYKIPRDINSADLMTHGCSNEDFRNHLNRLNQNIFMQLYDP
jgi:hypothetical protein